MLLNNILALKENPYTVDAINLNREAVQLKSSKGRNIEMTKGDKLLRSLRQLFEMNRHKLRDKVGTCAIARHLQCFILTKNWIDGSELVKNERGKVNEQGTDDQDNNKQATEDVEMHSEN